MFVRPARFRTFARHYGTRLLECGHASRQHYDRLSRSGRQSGLGYRFRSRAKRVGCAGSYAATQMASLLCAPLFVGLIIVTHDLVALAFGDRWLPVVPTIQILAFDAMLYCVFMFGDVVFTALGRPKSTLFRSCFHFAVSLIGLRVFPHVWLGRSCTCLGRELLSDAPTDACEDSAAAVCRYSAQHCAALHCRQRHGHRPCELKAPCAEILDEPAAPRRSYQTGAMIYAVSIRILAPSLTQRFFGLVKSATLAQQAPAAIDSTP